MPWKSGLNVNCLNPNCLHDVSHTNIVYSTDCPFFNPAPFETLIFQPCALRNSPTYIHPSMVGMIYPVPTYIFNWHISPNTNQYHEYIQLIYILLIEYFPTLRPKGSQKISKLHSSPRVGIIYPISPYIFNWLYILEIVYFPTPCTKGAQKHSNLHFSHGWHDISNTNIYF